MNSIITVPPNVLSHTGWMKVRDALLAESRMIEVVDSDESLSVSGAAQTAISKHIKAMGEERLALTRQLDAVKKDIMGQEKVLIVDLDAELSRLRYLNNAYATEVARKAAEERKRREEEENQRRMAEAAAAEKAQSIFGEAVTVAPEPAPAYVAPPEKPSTATNRMVERWTWTIRNSERVPRNFLSVDEAKIRAHVAYCQKMKTIPTIDGVEFDCYMSVESR